LFDGLAAVFSLLYDDRDDLGVRERFRFALDLSVADG